MATTKTAIYVKKKELGFILRARLQRNESAIVQAFSAICQDSRLRIEKKRRRTCCLHVAAEKYDNSENLQSPFLVEAQHQACNKSSSGYLLKRVAKLRNVLYYSALARRREEELLALIGTVLEAEQDSEIAPFCSSLCGGNILGNTPVHYVVECCTFEDIQVIFSSVMQQEGKNAISQQRPLTALEFCLLLVEIGF